MKKLRLFDDSALSSVGLGRLERVGEPNPNVCDLVWQGDLGKGIWTGSGVWSDPGANPCLLYGPPGSTTTVDQFVVGGGSLAIPQVQWRLGMTVNGDAGAEFVFCKLVLAGTTDLLPGQAYQVDERFTATLLSTTNANNLLNNEVLVGQVFANAVVAGTYYIWLQRAGHLSILDAGSSAANGLAETSASTAGAIKFPAAATAGQKSIGPANAFGASSSVTFTGNTVNGSPYINAVLSSGSLGGIEDLQLGQTITGTNLPANACIAAIDRLGGGNAFRISIGTATAGNRTTLQNATGTANGTTFTVTSHLTANWYWPTLNKQN